MHLESVKQIHILLRKQYTYCCVTRPLEALGGRPRVDVLCNMSGIFSWGL
jgi:hypothetical protein